MQTSEILNLNEKALSKRFYLDANYKFSPISSHNKELHKIRREFPYFGYVDIMIDGVKPFAMLSNNDDLVAQTYFFYGVNSYETVSIHLWRELAKKSDTIFDVGGFTGLYTIVGAKVNLKAQVFVFEPIKRVFGRLITNLAVNQLGTRVVSMPIAIGNSNEVCEMNVFQGNLTLSTGSSLIAKAGKEVDHQEYVKVVTFDDFVNNREVENVSLIKIDVEQAEVLAIEGMKNAIKSHCPQMLIEVTGVKTLFELYDTLSIYDYNFVVIDDLLEKAYINSFDAFGMHKAVRNVFFTTLEEQEITRLFHQIHRVKLYSNGKLAIKSDGEEG